MGLANRLAEPGRGARRGASRWPTQLAAFPQRCMRADRLSAYEQWALPLARRSPTRPRRGLEVIRSRARRSRARRASPPAQGVTAQF